jgi:hypothetical protein
MLKMKNWLDCSGTYNYWQLKVWKVRVHLFCKIFFLCLFQASNHCIFWVKQWKLLFKFHKLELNNSPFCEPSFYEFGQVSSCLYVTSVHRSPYTSFSVFSFWLDFSWGGWDFGICGFQFGWESADKVLAVQLMSSIL